MGRSALTANVVNAITRAYTLCRARYCASLTPPVSKLAVLELRKTFLSRVARPPRGRDVIGTATVCTILEWAGLASTPFMEYLLLKFLRKCP